MWRSFFPIIIELAPPSSLPPLHSCHLLPLPCHRPSFLQPPLISFLSLLLSLAPHPSISFRCSPSSYIFKKENEIERKQGKKKINQHKEKDLPFNFFHLFFIYVNFSYIFLQLLLYFFGSILRGLDQVGGLEQTNMTGQTVARDLCWVFIYNS